MAAASAEALAPEDEEEEPKAPESNFQLDVMESIFARYDKDGSGVIDAKETLEALREVGIEVAPAMATKVMQGYDTDGSGALGLDEFKRLVLELRQYQAKQAAVAEREAAERAAALAALPPPADDIEKIFRQFDKDHSQIMDSKELMAALAELGLSVENSDAAKKVLQTFDADKSGTLKLDEFRKLVTAIRAFFSTKAKPRIAALEKKVAAKAYLPRFKANKPPDEKVGSFLAYMAAREEAAAEDEKARRAAAIARRRSKKGVQQVDEGMSDEDKEAWISLALTVAFTVLLALSEAFDLDVLIGFALYPFITAMKWLADKFDNVDLDPTIWAAKFGHASVEFAKNHCLGFVVVDFVLFGIFATFFLFQADIDKWREKQKLAAAQAAKKGYSPLEDDSFGGGFLSKVADDPDEVRLLLRQAGEDLEEHNMVMRLRARGMEPEVQAEMEQKRTRIEKQIETYNNFLSALESAKAEAVDLEEMARLEAEAEAKKKRDAGCTVYVKMFVGVIKNGIAGCIAVYLYCMDLLTDIQVTILFYNAGAMAFAFVSACLLVGQFVVVWVRVLPYLRETYGEDSFFYRSILFGGMPFGMLFLDALMFLGPFGLLPTAPMPESLRQFIPAYAATRSIAEVLIEALPQCIMQAVILVMVTSKVRNGTASQVEYNLMAVQGGSFTSTLPKSIFISTLTMLKTWYELIQEAREAGIGVAEKGVQLWNVGYGLPLDAIKSGSLLKWKCQYKISDKEVVSLVDALGKNDSLEYLDLSLAGFEWMPPVQREERNAITTILTVMNGDPKALEALEKLIICPKSRWEVPVLSLRSGPSTALKTLQSSPFLTKGGPQRKEIFMMFELLCKNRNAEPGESELEMSYNAVTKIFEDSRNPKQKPPQKRTAWQNSVAQLISKGMTRRAHFKVVVGAEVLHNIGFGAQELLDIAFSPQELKDGGFKAKELKAVGFKASQLKDLGYSAKEMWEAEIPVPEMKSLGYTVKELKDGGYTAQQMRDAKSFTLTELKAGKYKALELGEAGFPIADLRVAKFTAADLRKAQAQCFQVQMMREAGYTVHEMKSAGYDATRIRDAGYDANEATSAGYTVTQMHGAGYSAGELRKAGFTALVLREDGYDLNELQGAGYSGDELMQAGYTAQELKEAGTSLVQLKAAGTPIANLKEAGYTAQRLRQQGYTASELATGSRGRIDLRTGVVSKDEGGYTAKEMKAGGVTGQELKRGKIYFTIAEFKDGSWTTRELKDGGYSAGELRGCGYGAAELAKVGYTIQDLVTGGFHASALRAIGAPVAELREAGLTAKELSEVGYTAKELYIGGYSAKELIACGFGVGALCEAGFDAIQLRALGFSAKELKAYGYGAKALKDAGSLVKELKELGFPDDELESAGFTRRAVEAVDGRSVQKLKDQGKYEAAELKEYGYVVVDLRGIYTVKDMKDQGFSLEELSAGGVPEHAVRAVDGRTTKQLRKAGYPAKILRKVGFSLEDIVDGKYTATELKEADYNATELKEVKFNAGQLREAEFTSRQLQEAKFTLREMQRGGYHWKDLVIFLRATCEELTAAGYPNLDPKHRLFLEYRYIPPDEEEQIHDLSVLSPRYRGTYLSANVPGLDFWHSGDSALVLREEFELESEKICDVPANTHIDVLEQRPGESGGLHMRAKIRFISKGWITKGMKEGWVTSVQADGKALLRAPPGLDYVTPNRLPPPGFFKEPLEA